MPEDLIKIPATSEQWRQLRRVLADPDVLRVAGRMFAVPVVWYFAGEVTKLIPDHEEEESK